jgi:hypothetical protein
LINRFGMLSTQMRPTLKGYGNIPNDRDKEVGRLVSLKKTIRRRHAPRTHPMSGGRRQWGQIRIAGAPMPLERALIASSGWYRTDQHG